MLGLGVNLFAIVIGFWKIRVDIERRIATLEAHVKHLFRLNAQHKNAEVINETRA